MVREAYWPTRIPQRCRSTSDPHSQSLWRRSAFVHYVRSIWPLRNTEGPVVPTLLPCLSLSLSLSLLVSIRRIPSSTRGGQDSQEGCRCAIIFAWFRSAGQIKTADGTQRRVRLRSALRSKTEFPRTGGRYVRVCAATRATRSHPRLPGPNFVATSGQRRKQMKKFGEEGRILVRTSVDRRSLFAARFGLDLSARSPISMFRLLTKLWMISGGNWPRDQRRDW